MSTRNIFATEEKGQREKKQNKKKKKLERRKKDAQHHRYLNMKENARRKDSGGARGNLEELNHKKNYPSQPRHGGGTREEKAETDQGG